jgi:hypothetical protein
MCLKYPLSGHSRQHSDVAMAVDLRRHQGGEAAEQLEWGEDQRTGSAAAGLGVVVDEAVAIEFA